MSKHKNHTNYYKYSKPEPSELESEAIDILEEEEHPKILFLNTEEGFHIEEPEISPEEKSEKVDVPMTIVLKTNLFIRETPYGDKVKKDELDRIIASKVIKDGEGWAIVPKETKTEVYDMMVHEDGSIWYATRFGYLLGKTKSGKVYVE